MVAKRIDNDSTITFVFPQEVKNELNVIQEYLTVKFKDTKKVSVRSALTWLIREQTKRLKEEQFNVDDEYDDDL